jgi:acyl-CoA thioester hydrolase
MHFLRDNGIPYMQEFHDKGIVLVVLAVDCKYMKTLVAEDTIRVDARLQELGRTRAKFAYEVYNADGDLCAAGHTEHAFVDPDKRPLNLAKHAPALWSKLGVFRDEHLF